MTRRFLMMIALLAGLNMLPRASAADPTPTNLFNGKDLTGWHTDVPERDNKPDTPATFVVRDGLLVSLGQLNTARNSDDKMDRRHHLLRLHLFGQSSEVHKRFLKNYPECCHNSPGRNL